jgi:glycosyltransferase involved in cell wall biosynthesis
MNAARAVIVTDDVGSAPDLIEDGVNGCIYAAGDVVALAAALRRVLQSPESAATMGKRAYERIQSWSFERDVQGLRKALAHIAPGFVA